MQRVMQVPEKTTFFGSPVTSLLACSNAITSSSVYSSVKTSTVDA